MAKCSVVSFLFLLAASALPAQEAPMAVEELLERSRSRLEALQQNFEDLLTRSVKEFESKNRFEADDSERLAKKLGQWVAVFPEPIVAAFKDAKSSRARGRLADVLEGAHEARLASLLIPLLDHQDEDVRRETLRVLASVPSKAVPKALIGVLERKASAAEKSVAIEALAASAPAECASRVGPFLSDNDPVLRNAAVRALRVSSSENRATAKRLVAIATDDQDLSVRAEALRQLAYFPDEDAGLKCLHEAVTGEVPTLIEAALTALDTAAHKTYSKLYLKKACETAPSKELKERAAHLLMVRLQDSSGVRQLLSEQTGQADRRPRNPGMQQDMGDEFRRFGAYNEAIDYYKKALEAFRLTGQKATQQTHVNIARCYARLGKYADARKSLKAAGYNKSLAPFANEEDFAEMREDKKYAAYFTE